MADDNTQPRLLSSRETLNEVAPRPGTPAWLREIPSRPSRASSIISTRTRFSTTTFQDDARSIDIDVGGHYFRISRDGSRITEAPPPYSGPVGSVSDQPLESTRAPVLNISTARGVEDDQNSEQIPISRFHNLAPVSQTEPRANILNPSEIDIPSPVDDQTTPMNRPNREFPFNEVAPDLDFRLSRNPSYQSGPEVITVPRDARKPRAVSQDDLSRHNQEHTRNTTSLRRRKGCRNGVRLHPIVTNPADSQIAYVGTYQEHTEGPIFGSPESPLFTRSAGPVLDTVQHVDEPRSPTFIGRDAQGIFPKSGRHAFRQLHRNRHSSHHTSSNISVPDLGSRPTSSGRNESVTPPPMDSENDISLHYARIMRRLDQDHRRALHAKDKEMAGYRERLNEVDMVYRQELKARDFIIDDLRKRLDNLEENVETLLEKARHEVEDLWESRWKDRDYHLRERIRRVEEEAQKFIVPIKLEMSGTSKD